MKKILYTGAFIALATIGYAQNSKSDTTQSDIERGVTETMDASKDAGRSAKTQWKKAKSKVDYVGDNVSAQFSSKNKDFEKSWSNFEKEIDHEFADFKEDLRELYEKRSREVSKSFDNSSEARNHANDSWEKIEKDLDKSKESIKSEYQDLYKKEQNLIDERKS